MLQNKIDENIVFVHFYRFLAMFLHKITVAYTVTQIKISYLFEYVLHIPSNVFTFINN